MTCLVGKNESGETALLQALHLLNPLNPIKGKNTFDEVMDYPSRKASAYKKIRETSPANVVTARFELENDELAQIRDDLGANALTGQVITVTAGYSGSQTYTVPYDEAAVVKNLISPLDVPATARKALDATSTVKELIGALAAIEEPTAAVTALSARLGSRWPW